MMCCMSGKKVDRKIATPTVWGTFCRNFSDMSTLPTASGLNLYQWLNTIAWRPTGGITDGHLLAYRGLS